jgi:ATP/maltotriose-dependent transcriptional regulator MalT
MGVPPVVTDSVHRPRLSAPLSSASALFVVLCAPSGYGKSVLAAQVVESTESRKNIWVDSMIVGSDPGALLRHLAMAIDELS